MTLCPIAMVAGCRRCLAFPVCPLKSVIGDYRPEKPPPSGPGAERESEENRRK